MYSRLKTYLGWVMVLVGLVGMIGLLFFYGAVLFSDAWPTLEATHTALRLLFDIEVGLLVMYASFVALCVPLLLSVTYGAELVTGRAFLSRIQVVFVLCVWIVAVILGFFATLMQVERLIDRVVPFSEDPAAFDIKKDIPLSVQYVFRSTLKSEVVRKAGMPEKGFEPEMLLRTFPGLTVTDFEGVEASQGGYRIVNGTLNHQVDESRLVHGAAAAITDQGFSTLLSNLSVRLGVDLRGEGTLTEIMQALTGKNVLDGVSPNEVKTPDGAHDEQVIPSPSKPTPPAMTMCTMDAKICPDGSAVGRSGPNCEFAACPVSDTSVHTCSEAEKERTACTKEYRPVCGLVSVQCVTTPCNPVPETFGNGCSACSEGNVLSYTEGTCQ